VLLVCAQFSKLLNHFVLLSGLSILNHFVPFVGLSNGVVGLTFKAVSCGRYSDLMSS
jgi:hypothetical protein